MVTSHTITCDRCGKVGQLKLAGFGVSCWHEVPKNWSTGKKDFCPKCRLAYKAHVEKFN